MVFQKTITDRIDTDSRDFKNTPDYSFRNPLKEDLFLNALEFSFDPIFSLKGELQVWINDNIIFDSKNIELKNYALISVPLNNQEFLHQEKIRIFTKNNFDNQKIGFEVTIKIGNVAENLSRPNVPLSRNDLAQVYSQELTPFPFNVYANETVDQSMYLEGYNKMMILFRASQIQNPVPTDYSYDLDQSPSIIGLYLRLMALERNEDIMVFDSPRISDSHSNFDSDRLYITRSIRGQPTFYSFESNMSTHLRQTSEITTTEITELDGLYDDDGRISDFTPITFEEEIKSYDFYSIDDYDSQFEIALINFLNSNEVRFNWIHSTTFKEKHYDIYTQGSWRIKIDRSSVTANNRIIYSTSTSIAERLLRSVTGFARDVTVGNMLLNMLYSYELIIESADDIDFTRNVRTLETFDYEGPVTKRYAFRGRFVRVRKRTTISFSEPVVSFSEYKTDDISVSRGGQASITIPYRANSITYNPTADYYTLTVSQIQPESVDDIDLIAEKNLDPSAIQNIISLDNFFDFLRQGGTAKLSFGVLDAEDEFEELISADSIGAVVAGQKKLVIISDESEDDRAISKLLIQNPNLIIRLTVENAVQTGIRIYLVK